MSKQVDMSAHFTGKQLLAFCAPSILMMILTSIYTVVDGFFVSNFAGKTAFAAVNFIMPIIMLLSSVGFMVGTGGSAIISATRGAGKPKLANEYFSLLVYATIVTGILMTVIGIVTARRLCALMGATEQLLDDCVLYGSLVYLSLTGFVLQCAFQSFLVAAGKPKVGLYVIIAASLTNIVLDFVLVGFMGMGLVGAALATNCSEYVGGLAPLIYFARKNGSFFKLGKAPFRGKVLLRTAINGSSEMANNVSASVVNMAYNIVLLNILGENGVAAYGVIMYVFLIFAAVFTGYNMGFSPLLSFQYGAKNKTEMGHLTRTSLKITALFSIAMLALAQVLAYPLALMFCSYDAELCALTEHAFRLFYIGILMFGFNIFGSAFFTALENGKISALLSFARTLVLETGFVFLLPALFGVEGIWFAFLAAESVAVIATFAFIVGLEPRYGYGKLLPRK